MKSFINNIRSGKQASGIGVLMACAVHPNRCLAFNSNNMKSIINHKLYNLAQTAKGISLTFLPVAIIIYVLTLIF